MEQWLEIITAHAIVIIYAIALAAIMIGTIEAFVMSLRTILRPTSADLRFRYIWVRYARWLVAGLTFQLAADIIETAVAPDWTDIGRLASIAVIRTFLNYFLERDLAEMSERK